MTNKPSIRTWTKPVCTVCRSDDVVCDAWAAWNVMTQEWELDNTFDEKFCNTCEGSCSVDWIEVEATS